MSTLEFLSLEHRRMLLESSAIRPEMVTLRGYCTVTSKSELTAAGFRGRQRNVPGLLIPIHGTDGSQPTIQFRPDFPRTDRQGRAVKHEIPSNTDVRIDCSPSCRAQLGDPSTPLWIT